MKAKTRAGTERSWSGGAEYRCRITARLGLGHIERSRSGIYLGFEQAAVKATLPLLRVSGGTSDTLSLGDSHNHLHLDIPATVTVTALLRIERWEEQAHLDELQAQSLMSKTSGI